SATASHKRTATVAVPNARIEAPPSGEQNGDRLLFKVLENLQPPHFCRNRKVACPRFTALTSSVAGALALGELCARPELSELPAPPPHGRTAHWASRNCLLGPLGFTARLDAISTPVAAPWIRRR